MNLNYVGSLAERFITLRSGVTVVPETVASDVFNSFAIYVPSPIATDALTSAALVGKTVPASATAAPVVVDITAENYNEYLGAGLAAQWSQVFLDGSNYDTHLMVVIFYAPNGSGTDVFSDYVTKTATSLDYAPLTNAYSLTFNLAFRKTLYFPDYKLFDDGAVLAYNYRAVMADLVIALAQLCKKNPELSEHLVYGQIKLPLAAVDTNLCLVASKTKDEEVAAATSLSASTDVDRKKYLWGFLNLIEASNTWMMIHSEPQNVFPVVYANYFSGKNDSDTYIGNKLSKVRLTGVKPTGYPSLLDSSINVNAPESVSDKLDDKNVGYLISIADGTGNDSVVVSSKTVTGTPVSAIDIAKWIDYYTTQQIAAWITSYNTTTQAVLRNEVTYKRLQTMLLENLQRFARMGRLVDIYLNMPAYSQLPSSKTDITVTQGWVSSYVDDAGKITITGMVLA
jgi:hypothetical protein